MKSKQLSQELITVLSNSYEYWGLEDASQCIPECQHHSVIKAKREDTQTFDP